MKKDEFLKCLEEKIIDSTEKENLLNYYNELIEDKIDSGLSEEEAVFSLGPIEDIIKKSNVKEKIKIDEDVKNNTNINIDTKKISEIIIAILLWFCLIFGGIFIIGSIIALISVFITSIGLFGLSFFIALDNIYFAMLLIGISLVLAGIVFIAIPSLIKLLKLLITECIKGIKNATNLVTKGVE